MAPRNFLERLTRFYNNLSLAFGCGNFYYDSRLHCYRLDHWPTLIYSLVVNVIYLVVIPFVFKNIFDNFHSCIIDNLSYYINWLTSLVEASEFMLILAVLWMKRRQLCQLANRVHKLLSVFNYEAEVGEGMRRILQKAQRLMLVKSMATFLIYVQKVFWVYQSNANGCENVRQTMDTGSLLTLIAVSVLFGVQSLADVNLYRGLLYGNMLLSGWLHEMTVMRNEVHALSAEERRLDRTPSWHAIHWVQLQQHTQRIISHQRQTKDILWRFVGHQRHQLLLMFLKFLFETVALAFDIVMVVNTAAQRQNWGVFVYLPIAIVLYFGNLLLLLYECEGVQQHFVEMPQVVFEIRQELSATKQCAPRKQMSRMLEMFSLEMQRKNYTLEVCGFFALNMDTASDMTIGVVMNLLVLIQYAFLDLRQEKTLYKSQ